MAAPLSQDLRRGAVSFGQCHHTGGPLMQRRRFLMRVIQSCAALAAAPFAARGRVRFATSRRGTSALLHLRDCRIAVSQYYGCHAVLGRLKVGDALQLHRQSNNLHDGRAIEVFWREHKLGYLPRLDNAAAASLLDRAQSLRAEIVGIDDLDEEWEPVRLRVWVVPA